MRTIRPFVATSACLAVFTSAAELARQDYPIAPLPVRDVEITGGFWRQRLDTHLGATIDHVLEQCGKTGRLDNFRIAAGDRQGGHMGASFNDSDVYKILEGMAWSLPGPMKPEHRAFLDDFIGVLARAQMDDGYLFTFYQVKNELQNRWTKIAHIHELYCAGHLFEAGAVHHRITGKRDLLDICLKLADHVDGTFGPGKKDQPPGHQEIELGLAELYRISGQRKHLDLARFLLEQRGVHPGNWYHQEHKPLLEETEAVGHAVRAVYGYCGMAEVAALTGDDRYRRALDAYWDCVTGKKMAITGGIGGGLWEAFDKPYFLPNRSAYNETCGSIAQVFWNHRMFRLTGEGKYLDVLERALYNGVLSGVQLSGDGFFYPNQLETGPVKRQPWFDCACCPSNIARLIPAQPAYLYATGDDTLFACLYADSKAGVEIAGNRVAIEQKTDYPWTGRISIRLAPEKPRAFTLALRIPGWATGRPVPGDLYHYLTAPARPPALSVNGKPVDPGISRGFARLERTWMPGDTVTLDLPMPVNMVVAHAQVKDDTGRVAIERGPIVYCVEGVDNDRLNTPHNLLVAGEAGLAAERRDDLLGGLTVITGKAELVKRGTDGSSVVREPRSLTAIPYFARANREPSHMAVFLLRDPAAAILPPAPGLATAAKVTSSTGGGHFDALRDQVTPARSGDHSRGMFAWDGREGGTEWVQYEFDKPTGISSSGVYWYDRFGTAQRVPKAWRLLYRDGDEWKPVEAGEPYATEVDRFNTVRFEPVTTDALRLEAELQDAFLDPYLSVPSDKPKKFSAAILEWSVE